MEERLDSENTKTRDLKECKNWRGVTLLPVLSKLMGRVIIERIQNGEDHVLRKKQAGFRKNKSTLDRSNIHPP